VLSTGGVRDDPTALGGKLAGAASRAVIGTLRPTDQRRATSL